MRPLRERGALLLGSVGVALLLIHCGGSTPSPVPPALGVAAVDAGLDATTSSSAPAVDAGEARASLARAEERVDAAMRAGLAIDAADPDALASSNAAIADAAYALGYAAAVESTATTEKSTTTPEQQAAVEFHSGGRLRYGLSVSLLQYSVSRSASEPGRLRNYAPQLEFIPPEVGFQFTYQPASGPWRLSKKDGSSFQLMSWGGMLLVRIDNKDLAQGAIRLGATLNFFENVVGLGIGFDLYRGIPVMGPNGVAGSSTVYTGLLSWAFSPQGELTPENVFIVLTFGLDPIVHALSGELGGAK